MTTSRFAIAALLTLATCVAQPVDTRQFSTSVKTFLQKEMTAHIADIKTLPQERVVGALTVGEYSWGTFLRSAAVYSALTGDKTVAGKDLAKFLGQVGLIEARGGGKAFSQMYAALGLRHFGTDLSKNPLWQSLTPAEQMEWRSLLDPARFYDRQARHVINLPENYFGVAARVATMDFQMGIITDRAYVDDLLDLAAAQFVKGAIYSDDDIPHGRFDRYSQEYARYVYEAADNVGRKDIMAALEPSLKQQLRLWWDLLAPDGYGYPWGRSLGVIGYMDTMEIVGFVAEHPQFRPAPLAQLAAAYSAAWQSLMGEYLPKRHLLDVFGFGKGHFSYINLDREWQQTTGFYGKISNAEILFERAMTAEKIDSFPALLKLPDVSRFEYFRSSGRPAGVWVVRQGPLHFALPITTGTKPGVADYLPSPHGMAGFDVPAEQTVPALTPFIELEDGRILVAGDGADEIRPGAGGTSLSATWKRWAPVGGKAGQLEDPGISTTVSWTISAGALIRNETIEAIAPITFRRFWVMFPSTGDRVATRFEGSGWIERFAGIDGSQDVEVTQSSLPLAASITATANGAMSRGSRIPVPLVLQWEARDFRLQPGKPLTWTLSTRPTLR